MKCLHDARGVVTEIIVPFHAVVKFLFEGNEEHALMKLDNFIVEGRNVSELHGMYDYLAEGDVVMFNCESCDDKMKLYECGWIISRAWKRDAVPGTIRHCSGIVNFSGRVMEFSHRHGVIAFPDARGKEHKVLFQASKFFNHGKRPSKKQKLETVLNLEETVKFDAIPSEPEENEYKCEWFATMVWKGRKPLVAYDNHSKFQQTNNNHLAIIRQIAFSPHSMFIRGQGTIMSVLNKEFGIALGIVKKNHWQTILFHRSSCFLFKLNLSTFNIMNIFKEGDRILFIATAAPENFPTKWVALQMSVYSGDDCVSDVY